MTIADLISEIATVVGSIPVDNVFWTAGALMVVGLVLGAFSVFAK